MLARTIVTVGVAGALVLGAGACGDDDDDAQSKVCDAQSQLNKDVDKLKSMDLSSTSVDDVKNTVSDIDNDLKDLKDAGSDKFKPQIDAVSSAYDSLKTTVSNLGSSSSLDDIKSGLTNLGDAAKDLKTSAEDNNC
jgi:hypothetical protein